MESLSEQERARNGNIPKDFPVAEVLRGLVIVEEEDGNAIQVES